MARSCNVDHAEPVLAELFGGRLGLIVPYSPKILGRWVMSVSQRILAVRNHYDLELMRAAQKRKKG